MTSVITDCICWNEGTNTIITHVPFVCLCLDIGQGLFLFTIYLVSGDAREFNAAPNQSVSSSKNHWSLEHRAYSILECFIVLSLSLHLCVSHILMPPWLGKSPILECWIFKCRYIQKTQVEADWQCHTIEIVHEFLGPHFLKSSADGQILFVQLSL